MARQVLPWVGAIVGNFIVPGAGASWGFAIGSMVGNAVDPMVIRGPEIGEGQAQTSTEGVPYNRVYGTAAVSGNVICTGPIRKWIKKTEQGKGGPVHEEERMSMTFAIGITCHEIGGVVRIWEDDKLVYDARGGDDAQVNPEDNREYAKTFSLFLGTADQEPSSDLEMIYGIGDTPAYPHRSYIVFPDRDLTERRGSVPNFRFEVTTGDMVVYPENRVPCASRVGSVLGGSGTFPQIVEIQETRGSFTNFGDRDKRVLELDYSFGFHLGFFSSDIGLPQGGPPKRLILSTEPGGGGVVLFDSGWVGHVSQANDITRLGGNVKRTLFDVDDPRYNEVSGNFSDTVETNMFAGVATVYTTHQRLFYNPDVPQTPGWSYRLSSGFGFTAMDSAYYSIEDTVVHPRYPASLYDNVTGEIIWACWAADEYFIQGQGGPTTLDYILNDIADYCEPGLDQKFNTEEVDGEEVLGFVIGEQYNAKNAIGSLQQTHFFDPSEYDDKIHIIKRGKDIHHVITEEDLVDEDPYSQLRKSSIEYPRKLNLIYQNPISGYDTAMEPITRSSPSVQVSGDKTITVPEVMIAQDAARVADKQMKVAWAEASGVFEFTVPASWHDTWVPSDLVLLYLKDTPHRLRIDKIERADGEMKIEASADRQSAYTSNVTTLPDRVPTPPPPRLSGPMVSIFLNIPALVDSNDLLGYYMATSGTGIAFNGGVVERRIVDLDDDYETILDVRPGHTVARLLAPIKSSSEHYRDTTNKLEVRVLSLDVEDFQSITDTNFLRENNAIAVVNMDTKHVEIMQFRDVEFLGDGRYVLSHLIRGRLNTEPAAFTENSMVVWLPDVDLIMTDASDIGLTFEHRATPYGAEPQASETTIDDFDQPMMQTEFPVDLLRYEIDGSQATVMWSPRERFGSDIKPIRSINWDGYQITYSDGVLTETFTTNDPNHVHDLSNFTLPVTVAVAQLNRYTGAGPETIIEIN